MTRPGTMSGTSAVLVTRGDVELGEMIDVFARVPEIDEVIVWNNGTGTCLTYKGSKWGVLADGLDDLAVYGRYAAIEHAKNWTIYVQDDDVLHAPEGISEMIAVFRDYARPWDWSAGDPKPSPMVEWKDAIVCNMPANFRHRFYEQHALVGFGAVFHRDAPRRAFDRAVLPEEPGDSGGPTRLPNLVSPSFNRTCDIVFTALTPRILVDIDYRDMPWASADNRMWKQSYHVEERTRMRDLVLQIRDGDSP